MFTLLYYSVLLQIIDARGIFNTVVEVTFLQWSWKVILPMHILEKVGAAAFMPRGSTKLFVVFCDCQWCFEAPVEIVLSLNIKNSIPHLYALKGAFNIKEPFLCILLWRSGLFSVGEFLLKQMERRFHYLERTPQTHLWEIDLLSWLNHTVPCSKKKIRLSSSEKIFHKLRMYETNPYTSNKLGGLKLSMILLKLTGQSSGTQWAILQSLRWTLFRERLSDKQTDGWLQNY